VERPDYDTDKDLSSGPFQGKGFTDELQRRIEKTIERRSRLRRSWGYAIGTFSLIAAAMIVFVHFDGLPIMRSPEVSANAADAKSAAGERTIVNHPVPLTSGVLIGLRTDFPRKDAKHTPFEEQDSSYRTLFVAPVNGQLDVAAEGSGILLPYGQVFWKVDQLTHETSTDVYHYLTAHPANKPAVKNKYADDPREQIDHSEKLLFVGNKYVSLTEADVVHNGSIPSQTKRVWVKELQQVTGSSTVPSSDAKDRRYVPLQDVIGPLADEEAGGPGKQVDNWAIVRKSGHWVPQISETLNSNQGRTEGYTLKNTPLTLPEAVVSYDRLCCTWHDIKKVQPDAIDALSSPRQELMAIITPVNIYFYETNGGHIGSTPLLTVELNENETLIMAQWATGNYVDDWIRQARTYLKK
jgi:hypothetical protein